MEAQNSKKGKPIKMHILEMTGLMVRIKKSRLNIPNAPYNKTLDAGLSAAISKCAKEETALISMEYPLVEHNMLHGLMGVKAYLLNLYNENIFCQEYSEDMEWFYHAYCDKFDKHPENSRFNIYTQTYINALFCDFLVKDYGTLKLTENDCKVAQNLLGGLTDEARYDLLFNCAKHFTYGNLAYNNKTFDKIFDKILNAIKHKNIEKLVVIQR